MKTAAKIHAPDKPLLLLTLLLIFIGLAVLFSSSSAKGILNFQNPYYFITHQILYGLLPGLGGFLAAFLIPYKFWQKAAPILFILTIIALSLLFLPEFGLSVKGATRWIKIGSKSFQPAEFLKLSIIIYFASFFSSRKKQGKIADFYVVTLPFLAVLAVVGAMLAMQPATGTLGLILLLSFGIYFLAGARIRDLIFVVLVAAIIMGIFIFSADYRRERVATFLNPAKDPAGAGYQINQAMIGIGSGGLFGVGMGQSKQKFNLLPETIADSIFAIFAEETGFVGSSFLVILYFLFAWRGFRIARRSPDTFSYLLAAGLTLFIVIQALINISAISGLIPLTGIPLPFVSFGGTALIAALTASGMLLQLSRYTI